MKVEIFCDGSGTTGDKACGFAAIVRLPHGEDIETSASLTAGTNNAAEIMGAVLGIETLTEVFPLRLCVVTVWSDSQYLVNGVMDGWGKRIALKPTRPNQIHWARLFALIGEHDVCFKWIRGHNGHPENTRCDKLANFARKIHDSLDL